MIIKFILDLIIMVSTIYLSSIFWLFFIESVGTFLYKWSWKIFKLNNNWFEDDTES